jgi:hypothetical protein
MWHVLEHVPDPAQMLAEVRRLLKPASVLIVAVPLNDNLEAQWFGANWASNDGLRHLVTFTRSSMLLLAERSGFRLEKQKGVAQSYSSLRISIRIWLNHKGRGDGDVFAGSFCLQCSYPQLDYCGYEAVRG